jgi:hypothetical protein
LELSLNCADLEILKNPYGQWFLAHARGDGSALLSPFRLFFGLFKVLAKDHVSLRVCAGPAAGGGNRKQD